MAVTDEELVGIIRNSSNPMQCPEMTLMVYRYTRSIHIYALKYKTSDIEADDLQQEGYIALFSAVKSYDSEKGAFSSFAGRCISNRMKNAVLKAHGKLEKTQDYDFGNIVDSSADITEHMIIKEYNEEIEKKLSSLLSRKEYEILKLYLAGFSYKQIAQKKEINVKSVDNSLSRTRKKLKGSL